MTSPNDGKLIGPNFSRRLGNILPWAEQQMGVDPIQPRPTPQVLNAPPHIGKLDAALAYNDNTGVTVSIWTGKPASDSGNNIDNVVASELLTTSGTFASGSVVKIEYIDGYWYVTGAPCT